MSAGKAVSWILDGFVKPIEYKPCKSSFFRFKSSKRLTEYSGESGFWRSTSILASFSSSRDLKSFFNSEASADAVS